MDENVETTRYRVNISTSVKGIITWDCTVESNKLSMDEVLAESDKLVKELRARYPIIPQAGS
jgi:predicted DNA-binding protein (UPF0278 family)